MIGIPNDDISANDDLSMRKLLWLIHINRILKPPSGIIPHQLYLIAMLLIVPHYDAPTGRLVSGVKRAFSPVESEFPQASLEPGAEVVRLP